MTTRTLDRIGGLALVIGSIGFVVVFSYLASTFGYPDVLDRSAAEVLPALADGGSSLRLTWLVYGALPLTLLVAGIASMPLLEHGGGRGLARLGAASAAIASVSMMVGLLRWPSIQWALAERWSDATTDQRVVFTAIFDGANMYLGTIFGEFIGETMVACWFAAIGVALWRTGRTRIGVAGIAMGVVAMVSVWRLITTAVAPVSAVNNALLPLWMIVLGGVLWRGERRVMSAPREIPSASVPSTV